MAHRTDIGIREKRFFLVLIFLYFAFRLSRSYQFGPELIHSYGGDVLFIPILMTSVKIVKQLFNFSFRVDKIQVAIAVAYSSIVFELLLPNEGTNFVSDPFDILAYTLGALIYVFIIARDTIDPSEAKKPIQSIH